jgi:hypothetical protein
MFALRLHNVCIRFALLPTLRHAAQGVRAFTALFTTAAVLIAGVASAECPFTVSGLGATPTAASDGLLLVRNALNVSGAALTAGTGSTRVPADVANDITANAQRLDVNGSGGFDPTDAAIITRYLMGFRGDALIPGGAGAGATRTFAEIQSFIERGCLAPTPAGRTGQFSYFFNNEIFGVNMTNAVSQLRITDNDFLLKYVGHTLGPNNALIVAFNVDNIGNRSQVYIYRADNTLETSYEFPFRFASAPTISPDGQIIGYNLLVQSGQLGVPSSEYTGFFARSNGTQIALFNGYFGFNWLADGRPIVKGTSGLIVANSVTTLNAGTTIPNTTDAQNFSTSPDGSKVAFTASASGAAQRHIYMINIDGTGRRQVTTSRIGEETQVIFSPNGSELAFTSDNGSCGTTVFVNASLMQLIPANAATVLDVTASDTAYALPIAGRIRTCATATISWR